MSMFHLSGKSRTQDENESVQSMLTAAARQIAKHQNPGKVTKEPAPPLPRRKYLSEQSEDGDSILTAYRSRPLSPSNKMGSRNKPFSFSTESQPRDSRYPSSKPHFQQKYNNAPNLTMPPFHEEKSTMSDDEESEDEIISHSGVSAAGYSGVESHASSHQPSYSFSRQDTQYRKQPDFSQNPSYAPQHSKQYSKSSGMNPYRQEENSMDNRRLSDASMNSKTSTSRHQAHHRERTQTPTGTKEKMFNSSLKSPMKHPEVIGGGQLEASSVGANVRVNWQGTELSRLHFAAIYLRWSVVGVLAEAATQNQRAGGYMVVDLSSFHKENGEPLFAEDFPHVFGNIFKNSFVPSVHEKFNNQGGRPAAFMPKSISDSFKLLVLCERLEAMLQEDVMFHIQQLLTTASTECTPTDSPSFSLVNTSLEFVGRPPANSLQEQIVHNAIEILVEQLPHSLPALEQLLRVCVERGNTYMAVLLFRETTENTIKMGQRVADQQTQETISYMENIKRAFGETRDRNHVEIFVDMLHQGTKSVLNQNTSRDLADNGLAFKQGVILHKRGTGTASGARILRINGDSLQWKKLNNRIWQPEKSIRRSNISNIVPLTDESNGDSFKICTKNQHAIVFTAQTPQACQRCVDSLVAWWRRVDRSHSTASNEQPRLRSNRFANVVWDTVARRRADLEKMGGATRKYGAANHYISPSQGDARSMASSASEPQKGRTDEGRWGKVRQAVHTGAPPARPERRYGEGASVSQESLRRSEESLDDDEFGLEHSISASKLAYGGDYPGDQDDNNIDSASVAVRSVGPLL